MANKRLIYKHRPILGSGIFKIPEPMPEEYQGLGLVIGLRNEILTTLILSICISLGLCFSSTTVLAQSPSATIQPGVSLPAYIREGPVPGGYITGYVLDMDGNPVPGATVSLLQDGQLWNPGKYSCFAPYPYGVNPQTTRIAYHDTEGFLREGSFLFGLPVQDEYTLTAEKDGSNGSVRAYVEGDSQVISVNITLSSYRQPTYSSEQLSYTGAVAGEIRGDQGYPASANISLWQDGQMVKMPDNSQDTLERNYSGQRVDYLFEHLAAGNYTVMAEYWNGDNYSETISISVGTRPMRADMVLHRTKMIPYGWTEISFTPTIGEFLAPGANSATPGSKPTPALPWFIVLIIIGSMACFLLRKNER